MHIARKNAGTSQSSDTRPRSAYLPAGAIPLPRPRLEVLSGRPGVARQSGSWPPRLRQPLPTKSITERLCVLRLVKTEHDEVNICAADGIGKRRDRKGARKAAHDLAVSAQRDGANCGAGLSG
jgi:hypothetical protein